MGTQDSLCYGFSSKGKVLKVNRVALVVMKGEKMGNLYKLLGETVIGRSVVATRVEPNCDNIDLWHMLLVHSKSAI